MFKSIYQNPSNRFEKIDPGFAVSARCIFVNKNYLATHSRWSFVGGSAAELASPGHFKFR